MSSISEIRLKPVVHWVKRYDSWILRNPEDITHIEVEDDFTKSIIDDIVQLPPPITIQKHGLTHAELISVVNQLASTGMLVGTKPPKPPKRKFTPLDLLYRRFPLINPDKWLTKHIDKLRWIWTRLLGSFLLAFLTFICVLAIDQYSDILQSGRELMTSQGEELFIPFVVLTIVVVSLHELGHAFTLKHYGGIVPEMGVFFMLLIPACYTNTSDSYWLKKHQEVLVIGAGIICQVLIAAVALLLWYVTDPVSDLHSTFYLLMVAALFTIALNLNPLSGNFDGYHLTVALTGINNLRSRSRLFYLQLIKRQPLDEEDNYVRWVLAIYAPLSIAYVVFVFTFLIWAISSWTLLTIPAIAGTLLILWILYFTKS
jgi:putative peptide zinc metalloprotease protein